MTTEHDEIDQLVRRLVELSRRFRVNATRLHPELSFAAYSLLTQLEQAGGARAGDLVGLSGLNKSTISRQLADLQRDGLVVRALHPRDSRVQVIRVSDRGRELLALANATMRKEVERRTRGWTSHEVATLRTLLYRYNSASNDDQRPLPRDESRDESWGPATPQE